MSEIVLEEGTLPARKDIAARAAGEVGSGSSVEAFHEANFPVFRVQLVREREQPFAERLQVSRPQDVARVFREYLEGADREVFAVLMLDTKNRVIGINTVSVGTLDCALVSPANVFKAAILCNAASLILAHNHPSGDPTPSIEDRRVTDVLHQAGKILAIEVLDHLVIGEGSSFCSLKEQGLL